MSIRIRTRAAAWGSYALLSVARDESRSGITRGSACIALGLIGERASIRWNAPFCVGANVVIHFEVQTAMLSIP